MHTPDLQPAATASAAFACYPIHHVAQPPRLDAAWNDASWSRAVSAELTCANNLARSSGHHPRTTAQLLYDDDAFYLRFQVKDHYVLSARTGNQSEVWKDSCVEFFFHPEGRADYVNLETNAGGHKLSHRNWFDEAGRWKWSARSDTDMAMLTNWHSLPSRIDPELVGDVTWYLASRIPFAFLDAVWGRVERGPGVRWRGNFYKCADGTSHPHWLSWRPVNNTPFRFHDPTTFGELVMQ